MVGVGVGSGVGVCVGADVGVGVAVGAGATAGVAVEVGLGTVLANGAGVSASEGCPSEDWKSEHPVRSMASIAPATGRLIMDFDIIALLDARVSTTDASIVAFRMTRRKVRLYLLRGVHLYLS